LFLFCDLRVGFRLGSVAIIGEVEDRTMPGDPDPGPGELLSVARQRDGAAVGQLLELYRNYLALLARAQIQRHLQGRVDASDVVQETFPAAHRDFGRFRGTTEGELVSWLRQIMAARLANLVRHHVGAKRRDVRLEQRLADQLEQSSCALCRGLVDRQPSPSQQAARREKAVLLADALKALPPDYAEVIVLHHLEGLSFPEVAGRMERSTGSVEKLWVRALVRLRRNLGRDV
jgi:RNA polymerase sigma-70 factor (ECF subfamily)